MVVGASGQRDAPVVGGLDAVLVGQRSEELRLHRGGEPTGELVRLARARAVPSLPHAEEEHHPLDMARGDRRTHPVERMRERVPEAAFP